MSSSVKSGLLFAVISFLANLVLGIFLAICTPVCGIVWGIGAGLLSIIWADDTNSSSSPAQKGAIAGGISAIGAIAGLIIGMILQFTVLGGQQAAFDISRELAGGAFPLTDDFIMIQQATYIFVGCCFSLLNVLVLAGAGAAAAHLYASSRANSSPSTAA